MIDSNTYSDQVIIIPKSFVIGSRKVELIVLMSYVYTTLKKVKSKVNR